MNTAFIGLGANIDDPLTQLQRALDTLARIDDCQLAATSRIYRSAPMGPADQPHFYNACAQIETALGALTLLSSLQAIEDTQGRVRRRRWGERCIDLDLLWMTGQSINTPNLTLPHPGLELRDFVLIPLRDLVGGQWTLPSGQRLDSRLAEAADHALEVVSPPSANQASSGS